jgi:16S rRNA (uracil1498-N3)-methyltransferase
MTFHLWIDRQGRKAVSARFYCPNPPREGWLRLSADEAKHLSRVCRLTVGDQVEVFDGQGFAANSEIVAIHDDWVDLVVVGTPLLERRPACSLALATAVPKGERFDWLVEKATELGVDRLIPILCERSVVEPRGSKLARLRRTVVEASKQCGRLRLMVLEEPARWTELAASCPESLRLLADRDGSLPRCWPPIAQGQAAILAVGPEGGFTPGERDLARQAGWTGIRLSANTLRIETAALAGCAALLTHVAESDR